MNKFTVIIFTLILAINLPTAAQVKAPDEWLTYFEKSGYMETPRYTETMEYFKKLCDASPFAEMFTFGISPQGREMKCVVVSKDKAFDPVSAKHTNKPIIFINNGIHSGEIEGKDASMLMLREILITKEKEYLLDNVILLVIPIFSVDAHERFASYNRINQNGPKEMGWRTTSQNLNLNRDWLKADAPEMQAMLKLFSEWLPDFLIDTHTTDGADYQYTITYGMEKYRNIYEEIRNWIKERFTPFIEKNVTDTGFLIAPYFGIRDRNKGFKGGIADWAASPRFSQGYAAVQNRPGLLIETHMLKPYKDRVFSTKALLTAATEYINNHPDELTGLNKRADINSIRKFTEIGKFLPLNFKLKNDSTTFLFRGIDYKKDSSSISGSLKTVFTGKKINVEVPYFNQMEVVDSAQAPAAYLIPKEWGDWNGMIFRMKLHGINVDELEDSTAYIVTRYKFKNVKFSPASYESRQRVNFDYDTFVDTVTLPPGTYLVKTNQRTVRVILHLLEPKAPDSFVRWGFMNQIFEQKEYFESYVMEEKAEKMMLANPKLKEDFEKKLSEDEKFRNNPRQRLNYFYKKSPYWDEYLNLYPVMRVKR